MIGFKARAQQIRAALLLLICIATIVLLSQDRNQAPPAKAESNPPASTYQLLAKGVVSSAPFQVQFKSAALRLEIRNLVMGHGETESIPTPTPILMEVRQGAISTTMDQKKMTRNQGDFWLVEKGSRLTIQNPGEVAVIRAIYIIEGSR